MTTVVEGAGGGVREARNEFLATLERVVGGGGGVNFRRTNAALGIETYLPYGVVTFHVTPRMILVQGSRVLVKA
jgi:hypothetical protein